MPSKKNPSFSSERIFSKLKKITADSYDSAKDQFDNYYEKSLVQIEETSNTIKTKFVDDIHLVKNECFLLNRLNQEKIPLSIKQSTLYAIAGTGGAINETELAKLSRSIMDNDEAFFTNLLETIYGEADVKRINKLIDLDPLTGQTLGKNHRLTHGHDLESLIEIVKEHEIEGLLNWINHVWLRDFWTPTGVPYLPAGTDSLYEYLPQLGISKSTAADILTINFWEVTAALLLYKSCKNFYNFLEDNLKSKRAKTYWRKGLELEELGDFEAADHNFENVLTIERDNPVIDIWYATQFLQRATNSKEDNKLWYKNLVRCYDLCSRAKYKIEDDLLVPFQGGVVVSLWGINSTLLSCTYGSKNEDIVSLRGSVNSGIESCIKASDYLMNPSKTNIKSFGLAKRPFSAITNDYIALNLYLNSPFDLQSKYTPLYIRNRISNNLNYIIDSRSEIEAEYAITLKKSFDRVFPIENA